MPEFKSETGAIFYEVIESAQPNASTLTLLHNFMSNGRSAWGALTSGLAEQYRLIIPDLPGHSRSQGYPADFDHLAMARQLAALMQAEGADDGHLAGCSSGGMIAQLLVQHDLVRARSLTLISTTHSVNPATTNNPAVVTPEKFRAGPGWMDATAKLHDAYHGDGYYYEVLLPAFRRLTPESAIDLPLTALQRWSLPVCIIHGEKDEFFPTFIVEAMAASIPNAELHIIPEQTHALLFRQPWKVRELMMDFLARQDDGSRKQVNP